MNGPMTGTSIQDLRGGRPTQGQYDNINRLQQMQQMQYGGMQSLQSEQGHNAAYTIQQAQHSPYYNVPDQQQSGPTCPYNPQDSQTRYNTEYPPNEYVNNNYNDMEDLAKDIANNLPNNEEQHILETYGDDELIVKSKQEDNFFTANIPKVLQEPLIIIVIYAILSHQSVYNFIGRYIKQVNPDASGKVPLVGILIYGIILAALYSLTKKFLLEYK
jgi:hypothetical protein